MESTINKSTNIITKFTLPVVKSAGSDSMYQILQKVKLRDSKVIVRGLSAARKKVKSADISIPQTMHTFSNYGGQSDWETCSSRRDSQQKLRRKRTVCKSDFQIIR